MKQEYDFSKGERGKFYNKDAELNFPVYFDPKILLFNPLPCLNVLNTLPISK